MVSKGVMRKLRYFGLIGRLPAGERNQRLHQLLSPLRSRTNQKGGARVVIQCVQDSFYLTLFAFIADGLRKQATLDIELFVPRSIEASVGFGWRERLLRSFPLSRPQTNQWIRLWDVVATRVAYRSSSLRYPLGDLIDAWRSWRLWRRTGSADELERLSIDGVPCGDLVIDTYLRFRPSPRVVVSDVFMLHVLWQAYRDVRRARHYFRSARPILYVTSYTTYIQHGIATRVALQEGVRVVSFGNYEEFGKCHSPDDYFQIRNTLNYRRDFDSLPERDMLLQLAKKQLDARLAGGIDRATSYMTNSAYRETTHDVPDVNGAVVIFLHDFYDSPHLHADLVFPDFWEWVCFTIDTLHSEGIRFFVKPHPNQMPLSAAVVDELKLYFPKLELVSPEVTNRQLVEAGMACAVTVYGTVAHEMAYMGVPTISCASHPHIAFDFCRTAKDRQSYASLLRSALSMEVDRESMREQALCFYVMHNLSLPPDQSELRDGLIPIWKAFDDPSSDVSVLVGRLDALTKLPGFTNFVDGLIQGEKVEQQ